MTRRGETPNCSAAWLTLSIFMVPLYQDYNYSISGIVLPQQRAQIPRLRVQSLNALYKGARIETQPAQIETARERRTC
jgi:hypothetical protein